MDKRKHKEIFSLIEKETILQNDKLIADTFHKYFSNIVKNIFIPKDPCFEDETTNLCAYRVKAFIKKYKHHPNINFIKDKISNMNNPNFSFNCVSFEQTLDEIHRLNSKKH